MKTKFKIIIENEPVIEEIECATVEELQAKVEQLKAEGKIQEAVPEAV